MADIYNVVRGDGVFFEGMTKEQIYELIAEMTGETVQDIDQAFITKLKEINKGNSIRLWVGTTAEYNALTAKEEDVLYVCTDDTFVQDTGNEINNIKDKIDANTITLQDWMQNQNEKFEELKGSVPNMSVAISNFGESGGTVSVPTMDVGAMHLVSWSGGKDNPPFNTTNRPVGVRFVLPSNGTYAYILRASKRYIYTYEGDSTYVFSSTDDVNINERVSGGTILGIIDDGVHFEEDMTWFIGSGLFWVLRIA